MVGNFFALPDCLVSPKGSWEMQNILRQKGSFQIYHLHVPTEFSSTVMGITEPTSTYYYIDIFVIRFGGRLLVRLLTAGWLQDIPVMKAKRATVERQWHA